MMDDQVPVVTVPGSRFERWKAGYEAAGQLERLFPGQEAEDFAYAINENLGDVPFSPDNVPAITGLVCEQVGENDERAWVWLVTFADGTTWRVTGDCDYTGWDCHSGTEWERVL